MRARVRGSAGNALLGAIRATGLADAHSAPCGGRGACGKCRVRILSVPSLLEPMAEDEASFIEPADREAGWRLSCRARFSADGEIEVETEHEAISVPVETLLRRHVLADGNGRSARSPGSPGSLRFAVDLGTTTIAGHLFDPGSGASLGVATRVNRQRAWGSDVISRIEAAADPAVLEELRRSAIAQIGDMMRELCEAAGLLPGDVESVTVAGNTVMLHILLGCDPAGLGALPFTPVFLESRSVDAALAGLPAAPGVPLTTMPGISAFVGGDISAGILAEKLHEAGRPTLLLDIGTNGEIVLAAGGRLYSTATAAGPAFEGANIECGSPSVPGAIDHAGWENGTCWHSTIGDTAPTGICGSGLLDIAAALLASGRIDDTGYMEEGRCVIDEGAGLFVSQADIRQIQLAKGAMAAGIEILRRTAGIGMADIREVRLAGGFGSYLDPRSALAIGLLPPELAGRIVAAGNTSLRGVTEAASSPEAMSTCARAAREATAVDLAAHPDFQEIFMDCMMFPSAGAP